MVLVAVALLYKAVFRDIVHCRKGGKGSRRCGLDVNGMCYGAACKRGQAALRLHLHFVAIPTLYPTAHWPRRVLPDAAGQRRGEKGTIDPLNVLLF